MGRPLGAAVLVLQLKLRRFEEDGLEAEPDLSGLSLAKVACSNDGDIRGGQACWARMRSRSDQSQALDH